MIPSITHRPTIPSTVRTTQVVLEQSFDELSFSDKLKKIGFIDDQFNILYKPSKIPPISHRGQTRWEELQKRNCCEGIKQSDYIEGFSKSLTEKGIKTKCYLRGGYAIFVACTTEYFEFALLEFCKVKNLDKSQFTKELKELRNQEARKESPHDVDLFDLVENGMPPSMLLAFYIDYMRERGKGDIAYLQKMVPLESPLFPYKEDYVLITIGDQSFQTDRIIGKLLHPYLFIRDDIKIEIKNNKICIPESAGNFWQMVVHRTLKVVETESWHEKDFRAGLAALQLMQEGHILLEDRCSLASIMNYALSTKDDKIFSGALDRARLHCKKPYGFLMSVLIAYLHADPLADVQIIKDAIGETPSLPNLYQLALLLTIYEDKTGTYRAEWDRNGFLVLHVNEDQIFFPRNFAMRKGADTSLISSRLGLNKRASCSDELIYEMLDDKPGLLERVLFELSLQKPMTPQNNLYDALLEYLKYSKKEDLTSLCSLLPKEFLNASNTRGWIKALIQCSFRHGLILYNAITDQTAKWESLDDIVTLIGCDRPNQAYALIDAEPLPKDLRIKLLKKLFPLPLEELISENALTIGMEASILETLKTLPLESRVAIGKQLNFPKILQFLDRLIALKDREWFFSTNPSQERAEALPELLLPWITWQPDEKIASATIQKHKKTLNTDPAYTRLIRQFQLAELAKEWISSFPIPKREAEALLFFSEYTPKDHSLLSAVCSLPGIQEKKLLEALHQKGYPLLCDRPSSDLLYFLDMNFQKNEILHLLKPEESVKRWMKNNPSVFNDFASLILETRDPNFLPFLLENLTGPLLQKAVDLGLTTIEKKEPTLKSTPLALLVDLLAQYFDKKMNTREEVRNFVGIMLADLLDKIKTYEVGRVYAFVVFFQTLSLAMRAKIVDSFDLIEALLSIMSGLKENRCLIDREFSICIQNMPFLSFDSSEHYQEWNNKRLELIEAWQQIPAYTKEQADLKEIKKLCRFRVIPYEDVQAIHNETHQLKLIIERYVINKGSKKEFQTIAPCEVAVFFCINDLLSLLTVQDTRVRAYEAFYLLLDQWKGESPRIEKQRAYLQIRQKTEKLIVSKIAVLKSGKILHCDFLEAVNQHLVSNLESLTQLPLNIHDPIIDAMDLLSIKTFDRIQVLRQWSKVIHSHLLNPYQYGLVKGNINALSQEIPLEELQQFFLMWTTQLKILSDVHTSDSIQREIRTICETAGFFLPEDSFRALVRTMEKTLCTKITYKYNK